MKRMGREDGGGEENQPTEDAGKKRKKGLVRGEGEQEGEAGGVN